MAIVVIHPLSKMSQKVCILAIFELLASVNFTTNNN